jgi:hypothetical protein
LSREFVDSYDGADDATEIDEIGEGGEDWGCLFEFSGVIFW